VEQLNVNARNVIVVVGAGAIGIAIARRVSQGRRMLLADLHQANTDAMAKAMADAGFEVETTTVDVSSRVSVRALVERAAGMGNIMGVIHAAGVSPSQAPVKTILAVDLYGTAVLLEEFGRVIAPGGNGIVIASQSGHRLPALSPAEDKALATTPAEQLLALPILQGIDDTLHAYQISKRCNALRVMAEAVRWSAREARLNCISPGIVMTPLANDELSGPRGVGYRRMVDGSPIGRAGTADEIAALAALVMGPEGGFITGSDFLIDGGVTASYFYGPLALEA
jgi:NAD(P)-dependent dehydrogenase (short-subunit alcohol dehydrogenase family)